MATEEIEAAPRTEFGKGAARRLRREQLIPAVVYAADMDPLHVSLPWHETTMALRHLGSNALLDLQLADGGHQLALTKEVQVDPMRREIVHLDFVAVRRGQKVQVDIDVHVVGEAAKETLVVTENAQVSIEAEATHIPEYVEVDIEGAEVGTQIHASELQLPDGVELLSDPETLIVNVSAAPTEEEVEAELEEAESEAGVERDESEEGEGAESGGAASAEDSEGGSEE